MRQNLSVVRIVQGPIIHIGYAVPLRRVSDQPHEDTEHHHLLRWNEDGQNTVARYVDVLCDAYLFEKVGRYNIKGRKVLGSPFKYYAADLGLMNVRLNFRQQEPTHLMENMIYNELRSGGMMWTLVSSRPAP